MHMANSFLTSNVEARHAKFLEEYKGNIAAMGEKADMSVSGDLD